MSNSDLVRRPFILRGLLLMGMLLSAIGLPQTSTADTLQEVRDRGVLRCGVSTGIPGYSQQLETGMWQGFDVDFCRAVAAAALGSADKVEFVPLTTEERFQALIGGDIDLLARNATWTLSREMELNVLFAGVYYHDGQGFLVRRDSGKRSALELDGARVCVMPGTTSVENAKRYFSLHRMQLEMVAVTDLEEGLDAFEQGKCDAITSDQSQLFALRSAMPQAETVKVLPEVISKEPLGPVVRADDSGWFRIVRWTLNIMISAEELGIDTTNVERIRDIARNPQYRRLLGVDGELGRHVGLEPGWAFRIIKQVGNYAEVFDRNLGASSRLGIGRGLNAGWREGGLLYAPPTR